MIIGLYLRHYKIYENIHYIPISYGDSFSAFIGDNGVGKSSVLEALDTYFNGGIWKTNSNAKRAGNQKLSYISPVFLIPKDEIHFDDDEKELLEQISIKTRNLPNSTITGQGATTKRKINHQIEHFQSIYTINDYYFFILSIGHDHKAGLEPFENFKTGTLNIELLDQILFKIKNHYSYIYIPVELPVDYVVNFQSKQLEGLIDKDLAKGIEGILKSDIKVKGERRQYVDKPLLTVLNEKLEEFVNEIECEIQQVDATYKFETPTRTKNINASHLRDKILETYFYIRRLQKNGEDIKNLSSGEQRKTMLDVVSAFLSGNRETNKKIIFAIDEPETSMHISSCLGQFEKLFYFSEKNQVIFSTHRYGFLPVFDRGEFHHINKIEDNIDISSFHFKTYMEERGSFPDDIQLKSIFDLVVSIITTLKDDDGYDRIICEGSDDKNYLQAHIGNITRNIKILPVGGSGMVIKLYKYLQNPIFDKKESIKRKILCLIDSDEHRLSVSNSGDINRDNLVIRRLQKIEAEQKIKLFDLSGQGIYSQTEIEDSLNPHLYYQALYETSEQFDNEDLKQAFEKFEFNSSSYSSSLKGDNSILKNLVIDFSDSKKIIQDFATDSRIKYMVSEKYKQLYFEQQTDSHEWVNQIASFLTNTTIE